MPMPVRCLYADKKMYDVNDTMAAISSGQAQGLRHILRLSGTGALKAASSIQARAAKPLPDEAGITATSVLLDDMAFDASAYIFIGGRSYTGEELVELHIECPQCVAAELLKRLCELEGVRAAGPGEFTARAYLNGKLDLSQAEAVAQIISGSNAFQLQAAQRLLAGGLTEKVLSLRKQILELLSLLEAGLDFSEEDISFITESQAARRVADITAGLEQLLESNIKYERMIGLSSVTIAGCPNAGKSSLLNALLGRARVIVSAARATTRDVISEVLEFENCACVVSDCAGIIKDDAIDEIDGIAQRAAVEAVNASDIVIFCVDIRGDDFSEELRLFEMIKGGVIAVATKSDMLSQTGVDEKLAVLEKRFGLRFVPLCTADAGMVAGFRDMLGGYVAKAAGAGIGSEDVVAVNRRHYESIELAAASVRSGLSEIQGGSEEVAAMYLRAAYQTLSGLDCRQSVDECILDKIFSSFCIGK